jgi:hypothetical protein
VRVTGAGHGVDFRTPGQECSLEDREFADRLAKSKAFGELAAKGRGGGKIVHELKASIAPVEEWLGIPGARGDAVSCNIAGRQKPSNPALMLLILVRWSPNERLRHRADAAGGRVVWCLNVDVRCGEEGKRQGIFNCAFLRKTDAGAEVASVLDERDGGKIVKAAPKDLEIFLEEWFREHAAIQ